MEISISIEPYLEVGKEKLTQYIVDILELRRKMALLGHEISLHFDYFKPNLDVFTLVQSFSDQIDIDLHLMQEPAPSIEGFRSVSIDVVDLKKGLFTNLGKLDKTQRGLVLDLGCEIEGYEDLVSKASYIIVMTVKCGKSGQAFQSSALPLIGQIRALNPNAKIIIDGGVNENNINLLRNCDVNVAVVGSYAKNSYENGIFEFSINRLLRV